MIHTIELKFEVYRFGIKPPADRSGIPPYGWYYRFGGEKPVGPFPSAEYAKRKAEDGLRGGYEYYSNEAFAARQRHQRNEDHIPDTRGG